MPTPPSNPAGNATEPHVAAPSSALVTPSPLAGGTVPQTAPSPAALSGGAAFQVPGYEVLGELGRGGMGVVYLAKNVLMNRREVLKVVNRALLDRPGVTERFLREIRSAAMLDHNNVVKAYSALQAGGSLVLAMEYVEGEDLNKLVQRQGPLPVPHACFYVSQAARGLQHAHERGMVHRDIKPHNLILSRPGRQHIVKVLDFGLAKARREGEDVADLTGVGATMGTPAFMAPEQALDAASADIRADVYSLGCTLYYLLTGAPPFKGRSFFEILQAHVSTEATPLDRVRAGAPPELAAVVAKMMAKEPARRYQTPAEAAKALAPFIKAPAKAAAPAKETAPPAASVRRAAVPPPIPAAKASATPAAAAFRPVPKKRSRMWAAAVLAGALLLLAGGAVVVGCAVAFRGLLPFAKHAADPSPPVPDDPAVVEYDLTGGCRFVHFGPDGPKVVLANPDDATPFARVYDLNTGRALTPAHQASYQSPSFSPDGQWVVGVGDRAEVWSASTGGSLSPAARPDASSGAAGDPQALPDLPSFATFSPGGQRILVTYGGLGLGGLGGILGGPAGGGALGALGNPPGGAPPGGAASNPPGGFIGGPPVGQPAVAPADPAGATFKGKALVCKAATGKSLTPALEHDGGIEQGMFSPDGRRIVTVGDDCAARVWNAADGKPVSPLLQHGAPLHFAAFSPDGRRVVTAGEDKMARVWDAVSGEPVCPSFIHGDTVNHAVFSPDGNKVVTSSDDNTARVWNVADGKPITQPLKHDGPVMWAVFSPDGTRVATAGTDSTARVWDAATGEPIGPPMMHDGAVEHVAFSPDGTQVVTASQDHTARLWDAATGEELKRATIGPD